MFKTTKLTDKRLTIKKYDEFTKRKLDLPPTIASPHFITLCFAGRGSGKTTLFINMWTKFYKKVFTHLYVISPTIHNDIKMLQICDDNVLTFDSFDDDIDVVIETIKNRNAMYNQAKEMLKNIITLIETQKELPNVCVSNIGQELEMCLTILKEPEPYHLIFVDDSIGAIYRDGRLRHTFSHVFCYVSSCALL